MVESRCGLLCGDCGFRESTGCGGCTETNGNPFYGECRLAKCCQNKGLIHCGQCGELPCDMLFAFSHLDPEHGDKPPGKRIEQLKAWKRAE